MDISKSTTYEQYCEILSLGGLTRIVRVAQKRARVVALCGREVILSVTGLWMCMNLPETRGNTPWLTDKQRKICVDAWMAD